MNDNTAITVTGKIDEGAAEKLGLALDAPTLTSIQEFRRDHGRPSTALVLALAMPPLLVGAIAGLLCGLAAALPGLMIAMIAAIPHWLRRGS